jgi:hypothetical protein
MKKKVIAKETIEACGTFGAFGKAEEYLKKKGYVIGTMCRDLPVGFAKASVCSDIAKWRNLSEDDIEELDGCIIPHPGFREGGCTIEFWG